MNSFLEIYKPPKLAQEEIDSPYRPLTSEGTESATLKT